MHFSPGTVGPASRRSRRRYADAPAAALFTGLVAGEWLRVASLYAHFNSVRIGYENAPLVAGRIRVPDTVERSLGGCRSASSEAVQPLVYRV